MHAYTKIISWQSSINLPQPHFFKMASYDNIGNSIELASARLQRTVSPPIISQRHCKPHSGKVLFFNREHTSLQTAFAIVENSHSGVVAGRRYLRVGVGGNAMWFPPSTHFYLFRFALGSSCVFCISTYVLLCVWQMVMRWRRLFPLPPLLPSSTVMNTWTPTTHVAASAFCELFQCVQSGSDGKNETDSIKRNTTPTTIIIIVITTGIIIVVVVALGHYHFNNQRSPVVYYGV